MPAAEASQCVDATIPKVPRSSGLVVKVTTQNLRRRSSVPSVLRALDDHDDARLRVAHDLDSLPQGA